MPPVTSTRTYTTYFNTEQVDELVGGAFKELESDYERRREHILPEVQRAIEARLTFLRACWTMLLDRVP